MKKNGLPIQYLIFSGGGAAGVAFAGAIKELDKESAFSFANIKEIAGTSMGSIAGLLVALNYKPEEILHELNSIDLNIISGKSWWFQKMLHLFERYGIYEGKYVYNILLGLIKKKITDKDPATITFADLEKLGYRNLHVVATKLYTLNGTPTGKRKIFSAENTPDTPVAAAILASCAAPFWFERVRLKKVAKGKYVLGEDGDLYNDGGIMCNLAIDIFDKAKYIADTDEKDPNKSITNPHVLALSILSADRIVDPWHPPLKGKIEDDSPVEYTKALYNSITARNAIDGWEEEKYHERVVQIDRLGVSLAQFDIDAKTKQDLVSSGELGVQRYFQVLRNKAAYDMKQLTDRHKEIFGEHKVHVGTLWKADKPKKPEKETKYEKLLNIP